MRSELARRAAEADSDARRLHDGAMAALSAERERQLDELQAVWRSAAVRTEMSRLAKEQAAAAEARWGAAEGRERALQELAGDVMRLKTAPRSAAAGAAQQQRGREREREGLLDLLPSASASVSTSAAPSASGRSDGRSEPLSMTQSLQSQSMLSAASADPSSAGFNFARTGEGREIEL